MGLLQKKQEMNLLGGEKGEVAGGLVFFSIRKMFAYEMRICSNSFFLSEIQMPVWGFACGFT